MSRCDPQKHHRRSVRLKGYDYSQPGAYFVTVCVRDRACCVLGDVVDGNMCLTECGRIVHDFWADVPIHFLNVAIDTFVVMPNHVHAIIVINELSGRGAVTAPLTGDGTRMGGETPPLQSRAPIAKPTLGQIVAYYKYQTTKQINPVRDNAGTPFWQRSFYDHVIRNQSEMGAIRQYIVDNPLKWDLDRDNPANIRANRKR